LLVEEIIETMGRVKRDRMHYAAQERKAGKTKATAETKRKAGRLRKKDRKLAAQNKEGGKN
jgi:hypothetical protein